MKNISKHNHALTNQTNLNTQNSHQRVDSHTGLVFRSDESYEQRADSQTQKWRGEKEEGLLESKQLVMKQVSSMKSIGQKISDPQDLTPSMLKVQSTQNLGSSHQRLDSETALLKNYGDKQSKQKAKVPQLNFPQNEKSPIERNMQKTEASQSKYQNNQREQPNTIVTQNDKSSGIEDMNFGERAQFEKELRMSQQMASQQMREAQDDDEMYFENQMDQIVGEFDQFYPHDSAGNFKGSAKISTNNRNSKIESIRDIKQTNEFNMDTNTDRTKFSIKTPHEEIIYTQRDQINRSFLEIQIINEGAISDRRNERSISPNRSKQKRITPSRSPSSLQQSQFLAPINEDFSASNIEEFFHGMDMDDEEKKAQFKSLQTLVTIKDHENESNDEGEDLAIEIINKCKYICKCRCFRKDPEADDHIQSLVYSSGEDEGEEDGNLFDLMTPRDKESRVLFLWNRAIKKTKVAVMVINAFGDLNMQLYIHGSEKHREFIEYTRKPLPFIVLPDTVVAGIWNLVVVVLMLYTATYTPYQVSFIDNSTSAMDVLDIVTNCLFGIDIIMNFITAYEDNEKNLEQSSNNNNAANAAKNAKLLKLTRLPRLYKLLRILRLMKMFRLLKYNQNVKRIMDRLRINPGYVKLMKVSATVFLLVHLVSCFYFMVVKFNDFDPYCWVVIHGLQDKGNFEQYITAMYWAFQTLTTVGYGDVVGATSEERMFSFAWMVFGVAFYSFTIGNLQAIISTIDVRAANLSTKLQVLSNFAKRSRLPDDLTAKIKKFIENNNDSEIQIQDYQHMLSAMPATLRSQVIAQTYGNIIRTIVFLQDKSAEFIWFMIPTLKPMKVYSKDILYNQGDHAEEVFFIQLGRVKLCFDVTCGQADLPMNVPFNMYVQGSYFGDLEILLTSYGENGRDSTAIVDSECHLMVITGRELKAILKHFKKEETQMKRLARKRCTHHKQMIEEAKLKAQHIVYNKRARNLLQKAPTGLGKFKSKRKSKQDSNHDLIKRAKQSRKQLELLQHGGNEDFGKDESQMSIIKEESDHDKDTSLSLQDDEKDDREDIEDLKLNSPDIIKDNKPESSAVPSRNVTAPILDLIDKKAVEPVSGLLKPDRTLLIKNLQRQKSSKIINQNKGQSPRSNLLDRAEITKALRKSSQQGLKEIIQEVAKAGQPKQNAIIAPVAKIQKNPFIPVKEQESLRISHGLNSSKTSQSDSVSGMKSLSQDETLKEDGQKKKSEKQVTDTTHIKEGSQFQRDDSRQKNSEGSQLLDIGVLSKVSQDIVIDIQQLTSRTNDKKQVKQQNRNEINQEAGKFKKLDSQQQVSQNDEQQQQRRLQHQKTELNLNSKADNINSLAQELQQENITSIVHNGQRTRKSLNKKNKTPHLFPSKQKQSSKFLSSNQSANSKILLEEQTNFQSLNYSQSQKTSQFIMAKPVQSQFKKKDRYASNQHPKYDNEKQMRLFNDTTAALAVNELDIKGINDQIEIDSAEREDTLQNLFSQETRIERGLDNLEILMNKIMQLV